jgi:hypothetical protein
MVSFFTGQWHGDGAFGNGKKISANVSYRLALDSTWLIETHRDVLPNKYKSISIWGVDPSSGRFVANIFDNSGDHRTFESNGWQAGKLVLSTKEYWPGKGNVFEHFIYERKTGRSFRMTFEVSKDGKNWIMIDTLIFQKINQ